MNLKQILQFLMTSFSFTVRRTLLKGNLRIALGVQQSMKEMGWLSIDTQGKPDIVDNVQTLSKIPDNSCDILIASHVLEHMPFSGWGKKRVLRTIDILKQWRRKMRAGAALAISVPDLDILVDAIQQTNERYWSVDDTSYSDIIGPFLGSGENEYAHHRMLYNQSCLTYCLQNAGFVNIEKLSSDVSILMPEFNPSVCHWSSLNMKAKMPT